MLWEGEDQPTYSTSLMHSPTRQQFMTWGFPEPEVMPFCLLTLDGFLWLRKLCEHWIFGALPLEHTTAQGQGTKL